MACLGATNRMEGSYHRVREAGMNGWASRSSWEQHMQYRAALTQPRPSTASCSCAAPMYPQELDAPVQHCSLYTQHSHLLAPVPAGTRCTIPGPVRGKPPHSAPTQAQPINAEFIKQQPLTCRNSMHQPRAWARNTSSSLSSAPLDPASDWTCRAGGHASKDECHEWEYSRCTAHPRPGQRLDLQGQQGSGTEHT